MLGPFDDFLKYRDLGLSPLPCHYAGKCPKIAWKEFQQRIATIEELREWCKVRCNVAIVTGAISRVVVVDVDSTKAMEWARKNLPEPEIKTRTAKGEHWYFRHPGELVSNRAKLKGMPLDIRGDGGYVLAAPSKHPNGTEYERLGDWSKIDELPVFAPSWITVEEHPGRASELPINHNEKLRRARAYAAKCPAAISGQNGHGTTLATALKLVRNFDLSEEDLFGVLLLYNERCEPRWTERELRHKAAEAIRIVKSPDLSATLDTGDRAMLTVTNPREDRCVICRKAKDGGDVEFVDKRFPGPVFMCWTDIKNQAKPEEKKGK